MTVSVVIADANILFSRTLRDYVLYAADEGAIEVRWSQGILDEMSRNLRQRLGLSMSDTDRLERLMNTFLEDALVDVARRDLVMAGAVEMDEKDRHVLAAALSADADIVLTDNVRHFPRRWMGEHGIELLGSRELLTRLIELFPDQMLAAHRKTVRYSPKSEVEVLTTLQNVAGGTVAGAICALASSEDRR